MPFINGGHIWLVLILVGVLVIFGPGKLPELGSAVGRTIREFKRSTSDLTSESRTRSEEREAAGEPGKSIEPANSVERSASAERSA
jgi:sec-independent protein translocase protein TatA